MVGELEDVLGQHQGVAAVEREDNGLRRKGHREEVLRPRERLFQVYHLGAGARGEIGHELKVDRNAGERDKEANDPVNESEANRSGAGENGRRYTASVVVSTFEQKLTCAKDSSANKHGNVEEQGSPLANLVPKRRVGLDRSAAHVLVCCTGIVAALLTDKFVAIGGKELWGEDLLDGRALGDILETTLFAGGHGGRMGGTDPSPACPCYTVSCNGGKRSLVAVHAVRNALPHSSL